MFSTDVDYEIVNFSVGDTKAGTKMGKLQLKNMEDNSTLNCILWEETLNRFDSKVFRAGNIVRIVSASFNERYNNCLVSTLSLVKEAKMGLAENEREKVYSQILLYFDKIKDEKLNNFLTTYFIEHKDLIKIMPAAKMMHHNYVGGLMVHILECLQYAECNMNNSVYKFNQDNIYAACILHDIGKIYEYTINLETGLIDYDENFRKEWLTHSQYGFSLCMNNGFKEIARMIAAHHGRSDWGAIIDLDEKDLEPELYFIHIVDNLSAKFGKINTRLLEEKGV
ncbi:putative domain HDIG-containing protein [Clostridium sp. CAG:715]|nr:putative domain HDIG-containing protein [Clostridium sp. CAG:715]